MSMYICTMIMYISSMIVMSVAHLRSHLSEALDRVESEPVAIERHGRRAAVLVGPDDYDRMVTALEDAEDLAAFDAAMAEEGDDIPWEQVKADLGWE